MPPVIDPETCTGCGTCATICNSQIFAPLPPRRAGEKNVPRVRYPEECWHCDSCVLDCPAGAIRLRLPLPYSLLYADAAELRPGDVPATEV